MYVGETKAQLRNRMSGHRYEINHGSNQLLYQDFNLPDHSILSFKVRILETRNIFKKDKRRKRYWNMTIQTTLWFNMKRRMPLKYKIYYEFKQNQGSFNTV